jgi:hypothetical protein
MAASTMWLAGAMPPTANYVREKSELDALLASGIFHRAPNLALLLNYVCARYFEGGGDQIKEYNIAIEALGRPADFDQKADSIVRVEAHRLRKRLREYYEGEGANHPIQIEIPSGQYAPRFICREEAPGIAQPEQEVKPTVVEPSGLVSVLNAAGRKPVNRILWIAGVAVLLVIAAAVPLKYGARGSSSRQFAAGVPVVTQPGDTIRILCGLERSNYIDRFGNTWQGDKYFQGGSALDAADHPIRGARDPRLYTVRREGAFRYDIPLKPGVYELRLHFAETVYGDNNAAGGGETSRVFNVSINGKEALHEFDVIADAGGASTADIKVFKDIVPASDGSLHLQFEPHSNLPILSGIEITPGIPGKLRDVRLVAQDHAYTDKNGQSWEPDRYANGGQLVLRRNVVSNTPDPDLYRGERFGNLTYVVPVADGRYGVTLYFSESWFGPNQAGGGGVGSRIFDILCNGVAIKRNLDLYKEAGGYDRAVIWTMHGIEPTHQGKLVISLLPVVNYASINALEVVDESR